MVLLTPHSLFWAIVPKHFSLFVDWATEHSILKNDSLVTQDTIRIVADAGEGTERIKFLGIRDPNGSFFNDVKHHNSYDGIIFVFFTDDRDSFERSKTLLDRELADTTSTESKYLVCVSCNGEESVLTSKEVKPLIESTFFNYTQVDCSDRCSVTHFLSGLYLNESSKVQVSSPPLDSSVNDNESTEKKSSNCIIS